MGGGAQGGQVPAPAGLQVGGRGEAGDGGRRDPISTQGRSPAATVIREAAEAMAESWLSTERMKVSSRQASAKLASTRSTGECGR